MQTNLLSDRPALAPGAVLRLPGTVEDTPKELVPFPFQAKMVKETYDHIKANEKWILEIAPPGAGKTFLASIIMRDATIKARKPIRCVFMVDLNCLIPQAVKELNGLGVECAVLQGSKSRSKKAQAALGNARVIVASIQTLTARMKRGQTIRELLGDVGLFFEDECHTTSQSKVADAIREEYTTGTIIIGLTATPWLPGSKKWLGQKYNVKVVAPSNSELIQMGRIVPAQTFSVDGVLDVEHLDIDSKTGDFSDFQMGQQIGNKASLKLIVSEWRRLGDNRSTVAYCPKVEAAQLLAAEFNTEGIPAEWQSGDTPLGVDGKAEHEEGTLTRAAQNYRLDVGITKIVCSVGTMTKGWNLKSLGCVMMIRATNVASLFFQISGRGSRTCESAYWAIDEWGNPGGKKHNYILLDFGSNLSRFAPLSPNTLGEVPDRDYDISQPRQRKQNEEDNVKYCPECDQGHDRPLRQFVRVCPNCDHEFGEKEDEQGALELDFELKEWFDQTSAYQASWIRNKRRACFNQNLSPDSAAEDFHKKFGFIPPQSWQQRSILNDRVLARPVTDDDIAEFIDYLVQHQPENVARAKIWFSHHWFLEFGEAYDPKRYKKRRVPNSKKRSTVESGWWTIFGLEKRCSIAQLKSAYRRLSREFHPDLIGASGEEKMKEINDAYDRGKAFLNGVSH